MDVTVVPVFGAHGVGVIGGGEATPSGDKSLVLGGKDVVA